MARGLRKRQTPFVQVPSSTIRDKRLSFRARGILSYLLDMPPEWDVRSEVIAANGTEGREAVRTALHELGKLGYYRLERRKMRDGTFEMGTAISEEPVSEWAAEYAEFDGKAVTVIEQKDGSFKVKRKDGRLVDDGFGAPGRDETLGESAGETGDVNLGSGSSGTAIQDSGAPGSGSLDAFNRGETGDRETEVREMPPSSASPAPNGRQSSLLGDDTPQPSPARKKPAAKNPKRATKERTPEEQTRFEQADAIATSWWARCDELNIPNLKRSNTGASGFVGFRKMIERALASNFEVNEIKWALEDLRDPWPSDSRLQNAVARRRGVAPARGSYGRSVTNRHLQAVPEGSDQEAQRDERREMFG